MMNSLVCLALAVSSFGGSLLAADSARSRVGSPVSGYSSTLPVSDAIPLWSYPSGSANVDYQWASSGRNVMEGFSSDDAIYDSFFDWGYLYFPVYLSVDFDAYGGTFDVTRVIWERVTFSTASYAVGLSSSVPYALGLFNPASDFYFSYEYHNEIRSYDAGYMVASAPVYEYDSNAGFLCSRKSIRWSTTSSGPYSLSVGAAELRGLFDDIASTYIQLYQSNSAVYYREGYDSGRAEGMAVGRIEGYNQGLEAANAPSGLISALFGSLVNVPISVINGLTPLAIWNTPIISLILTFVAIGAVLFIVKRLI